MGRRATILAGLAMFAVSSCGSPPAANTPSPIPVSQQTPPPAQPNRPVGTQTVELDVLAEGGKSDLKHPGFQTIRSAKELTSFVRQAGLEDVDTEIEWQEQMVLAIYAGDRAGTLDVSSIQIKDGLLTAKATFQPATTTSTAAPKGPYMLIVVPKDVDDVDVKGLPDDVPAPAAASPAAPAGPAASAVPTAPAPAMTAPAPAQGAVQLLAQGTASGVHQAVNVIIRTNEEWQAVWGTHAQGVQAQAQPVVDLTKQSVIGIFLGDQTTIGGIALDSIQVTQTGVIQVRGHAVPAAAQSQTAMAPFILVAIPKTDAPVDIQIQGGPQAPTLGNPQTSQQGQPAGVTPQTQQPGVASATGALTPGVGMGTGSMTTPGFGQPVQAGTQPGFGQPVQGSSALGGMPISMGQGSAAIPPFQRSAGGLLGPGGYVQQ